MKKMKLFKYSIIVILIFTLVLPAFAAKRRKGESLQELSDPNSPSYVPFPYPKNRAELIADIKYFHVDLGKKTKSAYVGGMPLSKRIAIDMFKIDTKYKIGKIMKVKNIVDWLPEDYYWLIYVMDHEGDAVMRITMQASGLAMQGGAIDKSEFSRYSEKMIQTIKKRLKVLEEKDIKKLLSDTLGKKAIEGKIKKIDRLGFLGRLAGFSTPLWQIHMKDGSIYYYSEKKDAVFTISEERAWKKDYRGFWTKPALDGENPFDFIPDKINDKLIILKRITKKN
jgi:hypothetical protein